MIYLSDFEPRILGIKYFTGSGKGEMTVDVQQFMENQTVTKIKKLIKVIWSSVEPEKEQVIADYCKQWLARYEAEQKAHANLHADYKDKVHEFEAGVAKYTYMRDQYRKKTKPYEYYAELLKVQREKVSSAKRSAQDHLTQFNQNMRNKAKYDKVLEFISQR
jgi:hypothetical protein|nr:MAG TPA: hypothetical protein [Caudoviricetes sp.]